MHTQPSTILYYQVCFLLSLRFTYDLGLLWHTLKSIEEEQHGRVEKCRMEMLAVWLQGKDNAKEQTWSTLVDAVGRIDGALSERIQHSRI